MKLIRWPTTSGSLNWGWVPGSSMMTKPPRPSVPPWSSDTETSIPPRPMATNVASVRGSAPSRPIDERRLVSMVLWGPPGCGKTTIARLLADRTGLAFEPLSATFSGVAELRRVFQAAAKRREIGQGTMLFVDEIHRFNRAQQDSFLPYVEDGTVVLVGA